MYKQNEEQKIMLIEDMFVNYYMINVNSYSSIRYFINNLITLCEWIYYNPMVIDKKEVAQQRESFDSRNSRNSNEQKKNKGNFFSDVIGRFRPNKEQSQNEEEKEKKEKEDESDFAYPELDNCFYQRFSLIQQLFRIIANKKEKKNTEVNEEEEEEENEEDDSKEQEKDSEI